MDDHNTLKPSIHTTFKQQHAFMRRQWSILLNAMDIESPALHNLLTPTSNSEETIHDFPWETIVTS